MDQARAWLGIALAAGAVAGKVAGKVGFATVMTVSLLQMLNLRLWRRDSATRKDGQDRFAAPAAGDIPSMAIPPAGAAPAAVTRAEPLFLLEELAWLGTCLWALVLSCWALGLPVHPLMYSAMLLLVVFVLLLQLVPQLRMRRPPAPKRTIVRSSQRLH